MVPKKFKVIIGVRGLSFDSANYTLGVSEKCLNLHGHTFSVSVEVLGEIRDDTGMVLDFSLLKKHIKEIIEEYDHKVLLPKGHTKSTIIKGLFRTEIKELDYSHATTEYIALELAKRLYERIKMPLRLKLFEGMNNYVIIEIGEWNKT